MGHGCFKLSVLIELTGSMACQCFDLWAYITATAIGLHEHDGQIRRGLHEAAVSSLTLPQRLLCLLALC